MGKPAPVGMSELSLRLREQYTQERERIREWHCQGATGLEVVHALSDLMDNIVRVAFDEAIAAFPPPHGGPLHLALAAQGGYGRRELNPGSDVDILGLFGPKAGKREEEILKRTFVTLWDAGVKVSPASRTVAECRRIATTDIKVLTSLLEVRWVAGSDIELARFRRQFNRRWTGKHLREFLEAHVRERAQRSRQFGNTINVAEPNLKESSGGLRDYHFVLWLGSAFYGAGTLTDLQEKGVLSPERLDVSVRAIDRLLRIRNALHFHTGRSVDQLSYDLQEPVALALGYADQPRRLAEELMMRDYYKAASDVLDLATAMSHITEATLQRGRGEDERPVQIAPGWAMHRGRLRYDNSSAALVRRRRDLIDVFWLLQENQAELSESLAYMVRNNLSLVDAAFRSDPEIAQRFRDLMAVRPYVGRILREMRATGFLGAYLPEWQRIDHLVRKDLFHRYTVDEHLLLSLWILERIDEYVPRYNAQLREILDGLERIDLLRLAVLLHDIGKGGIMDHSVVGARLAVEILQRLGYPPQDVDLVRFLVRDHLALSRTAFKRDIQAPGTVEEFVREVGTRERLEMLLLLTIADAAAVGGNQLTEWNLQVIWQVYAAARDAMTTQAVLPQPLDERRERIAAALCEDFTREEVIHHLEQLPRQYAEYTPLSQIARHLALLRRYDRKTPVTDILLSGESTVQVTICTENRIGLFARIARAFLQENLSIQDARLQNRKDGIVIDTITAVKDVRTAVFDRERQAAFAALLAAGISSDKPLEPLAVSSFSQAHKLGRFRSGFTPHITVSNEISKAHTVVQVHTFDHLGVLYTIAATFANLGYDIHFARVLTEGVRVQDVFYITGGDGLPIASREERDALAAALRRNLGLEPA